MDDAPRVVWQTPRNIDEVLDAVRVLGRETGTEALAEQWAAKAVARIERIAALNKASPKIRVAFLEWVDPLYYGGHWIPEMLAWAGAEDANARADTDSVRVAWQHVLEYRPEVIVVSPCGFKTKDALRQAELLRSRSGWHELPAVRNRRVYAVDGNAYFSRPGPRLIDGIELLAHLVRPDTFTWSGAADAYCTVMV